MEIEAVFEKHSDEEFLKFDRVEKKRSRRPDIHAFLLLDELLPDDGREMDIVQAATHDKIFLFGDPEELARVATEEQIIELIRCGVMFDEDSLAMFC